MNSAHSSEFRIRPAGVADLEQLLALERRVYPDPWTRGMFLEELSHPGDRNWLASVPGEGPVGFVIGIDQHDELHIANLAVAVGFRRRGIARALLERCIQSGRDRGARDVWLEVRASNSHALSLYGSAGFQVIRCRPRYYQVDDSGEREDALVLHRPIHSQEDSA